MDSLALAFLTLLCSILISTSNVVHGNNLKLSCDQTPYPQVCNSFVKTNVLKPSQETTLLFRNYAFETTLNHAKQVHQMISSMDLSSVDNRAKMAWQDCLELYEDTVQQLSQTLLLSNSVTNLDDIQTSLSAATTNHETCKNGFIDFNLSSHLNSSPFTLTNNFSKSLTDVLAVNAAIIRTSLRSTAPLSINKINGAGGGRRLLAKDFPSWISSGDRKLLQLPSPAIKADIVVAKDGSGNFKTISEAVAVAKKRSGTSRYIIYVKAGVYNENVAITNKMKNLMVIGDGIDATIVTSNKNAQDGSTTFRSATFGVSGDGFIAKGITFENTAGPQKHQAVAFRSGSDFSVFYGCSFKGYQDTLYVYAKRQFYKNCDIYGTVDFIFGDAVAVLQSCNIYVRKPMSNQANTVTAQGRSDPNENTGIVIHNSIIEAASDLKSSQGSIKTYLGRPWQMYSRVVIMKSNIDRVVSPAGWAPWNGGFALKTLYYGEYMNEGPGANTGGRVNWPGFRVLSSPAEAGKFTVGNFLAGDAWIPNTGVPFTSGL